MYSQELLNSVTRSLNCMLCLRYVILLKTMCGMHNVQFNAQLYRTVVLQKLQFGNVTALLYHMQLMKYIYC